MTIKVIINGYDYSEVLVGAPTINDQKGAVCRTLELVIQQTVKVGNVLGKEIELYYKDKRYFHGFVQRRGITAKGDVTLAAYDGLFFLKKTTDDFYFKNVTGNQAIKILADRSGVPITALASSKVVFKALWYPGKAADTVASDILARIYKANKTLYLLRWDPQTKGLRMIQRTVPKELWSFTRGNNLTGATYEENIEEVFNAVKLVNRETGKTVYRENKNSINLYKKRQHFEEVDKDSRNRMEQIAADTLSELSKVEVKMTMEGVNPGGVMGMFWVDDTVYVEEKTTGIIGAFNIQNITQTFNPDVIVIAADVSYNPDIPVITENDATTKPDYLKTKAEKEAEEKAAKAKEKVKK